MFGKVSVIIPAYNTGEYLKICLDSVLNQTYKNIEAIVINDGSTDETAEILNEYTKNNKNIIAIHTENKGVSCARNKGLDVASGEYVMFLDSDDYLSLNAIEILCKDLEAHKADVACAQLTSNLEANKAQKDNESSVWDGEKALIKALEDDPFTYSSCAKLYNKKIVENVRFIDGRKIHEDSYFVFSCFLKKPKVVVRETYIYNYRVNEKSASHAAFSDKYFDILYFAEQKKKIIESLYPELSDKANNILVKANISMLQCFCNTKDRKYKEDIKNCIRTVKKYKNYFVPAFSGDKKRFLIIIYNLYGVYKFLYQLKYAKRIR